MKGYSEREAEEKRTMMLERAQHEIMMCRVGLKLAYRWDYELETRTYAQLSKFYADLAKINESVDKFTKHYFSNSNWDELSDKEKEAMNDGAN